MICYVPMLCQHEPAQPPVEVVRLAPLRRAFRGFLAVCQKQGSFDKLKVYYYVLKNPKK